MEWLKLSTKFTRDPKILKLSTDARWAYLHSLCEVADLETDGVYFGAGVRPRWAEEIVEQGLWQQVGESEYLVTKYLKWNPTKAKLEEKRAKARDRMRDVFARRNGEESEKSTRIEVEVEVEVERELETEQESKDLKAPAANDTNPQQPTHDQLYLAEKLGDLTPAAIVKLNQKHGRAKVESAMREMHGFPSGERIRSVYAYLDEIAGGFE